MKTTEQKMLGKSQLNQWYVSVFYLTQNASRDGITIIFYRLLSMITIQNPKTMKNCHWTYVKNVPAALLKKIHPLMRE